MSETPPHRLGDGDRHSTRPARSSTTNTGRCAGTCRTIHDALDKVEKAGPGDDLYGLLDDLEKTVKESRDGGLVGSGATATAGR